MYSWTPNWSTPNGGTLNDRVYLTAKEDCRVSMNKVLQTFKLKNFRLKIDLEPASFLGTQK